MAGGRRGERRAVILSGAGRFADPWHQFAETSERLRQVLAGEGIAVEISEDIDARMADLSGVDLVVMNFGNPIEPEPDGATTARTGLLAHIERGGAVLSMHVASTSLPGIPEWESIMGGRWVRGTSMHPAYGRAQIRVHPERHPIVAPVSSFELDDERYSYLRVAPDITPLATHEHDGIEHPLLWARTHGRARVVYDALGHDGRSYDSAEHRTIVARAARWLLDELG